MNRKIRTDRLYKVVCIVVLAISSVSLLLGLTLVFTTKEYKETSDKVFLKCSEDWFRYDVSVCEEIRLKDRVERQVLKDNSFFIGVGLPIVFFGGTALLNYLVPKERENENV